MSLGSPCSFWVNPFPCPEGVHTFWRPLLTLRHLWFLNFPPVNPHPQFYFLVQVFISALASTQTWNKPLWFQGWDHQEHFTWGRRGGEGELDITKFFSQQCFNYSIISHGFLFPFSNNFRKKNFFSHCLL